MSDEDKRINEVEIPPRQNQEVVEKQANDNTPIREQRLVPKPEQKNTDK
jgi:hypothetical protein